MAKLIARLHTTAALWVGIQTSLKNTKWATLSSGVAKPNHSSPPKSIQKNKKKYWADVCSKLLANSIFVPSYKVPIWIFGQFNLCTHNHFDLFPYLSLDKKKIGRDPQSSMWRSHKGIVVLPDVGLQNGGSQNNTPRPGNWRKCEFSLKITVTTRNPLFRNMLPTHHSRTKMEFLDVNLTKTFYWRIFKENHTLIWF